MVDFYGYAKHHKGLERQQTEDNSAKKAYAYPKPLDSKEQQANKATMLARNQELMFLSPLLSGFALKNKLWRRRPYFWLHINRRILTHATVQFYIDDVRPVIWNDEAYEHLVYPEEQKDLVLTFVENHQRMKGDLDDVIVGKGTAHNLSFSTALP